MCEQINANNIVNLLEFGDDVEADVREVVLEHLQEHGKKVFCGLLLSKDGRQTANLVSERCTDVLRCICDELLDRRHDIAE